jgi:hypothetical protein
MNVTKTENTIKNANPYGLDGSHDHAGVPLNRGEIACSGYIISRIALNLHIDTPDFAVCYMKAYVDVVYARVIVAENTREQCILNMWETALMNDGE